MSKPTVLDRIVTAVRCRKETSFLFLSLLLFLSLPLTRVLPLLQIRRLQYNMRLNRAWYQPRLSRADALAMLEGQVRLHPANTTQSLCVPVQNRHSRNFVLDLLFLCTQKLIPSR